MNSLVLLIGGIIIFLVAFFTYGSWLAKKWRLNNDNVTPAHRLEDGQDYVPSDKAVIFGHHFSSIAGAGPITGPILAAGFGWLPAYLWIVLGSIFMGGVHDFGSLVASLRNDGKSIGEIIKKNISPKTKVIFNWYAWLTLALVVAAFTDICAKTFAYNPAGGSLVGAQAGTASVLFIILAFVFGFFRNRLKAGLGISTLLGVIFLCGAIALGYFFPVIKLSVNGWRVALIIYIVLASVLPVWLLLQPRDYLCSFLLYGMLAGAVLGIFIKHPAITLAPVTSFTVKGQTLFPYVFITIACGAISGFHSLVSSGTTSKQLNKERPDAKIIGYGSMLLEGFMAIVALIAVGYIATGTGSGLKGTPVEIFANGVSWFMTGFGLNPRLGKVFITLAFSAFALTSLDTATRIGRYTMQELGAGTANEDGSQKTGILAAVGRFCANRYVATLLTVGLGVVMLVAGYAKIWPIFGSANQLLAALALLAITAWNLKEGRRSWETIIPLVFMFAVTLTALFLIIRKNLSGAEGAYVPLAIIGIFLAVLAVAQLIEAIVVFGKEKKNAVTQ
ncbi:MAG: carbon starvation protein A [Treponema sp.]|jgi:carbon starvation protein|nr:carbon starvation protein A [Treponema sp.]